MTCAENANHTMHNIQTLRGGRTRDAANFAHYLDEAIDMFGGDAEVHFGRHTWPVWGQPQVTSMSGSWPPVVREISAWERVTSRCDNSQLGDRFGAPIVRADPASGAVLTPLPLDGVATVRQP